MAATGRTDARPDTGLQGRLERVVDRRVVGWAWDRLRPGQPVEVEFLVDGVPVGTTRADRFRGDLAAAGIGTGAHGFAFAVPPMVVPSPGAALIARVSGTQGTWQLGSLPLGPAAPPADTAAPPPPPDTPPAAAPAIDLGANLAAARMAEQAGDLDGAAMLLDAALALWPSAFDPLFLRARIAFRRQDMVVAERCARAALAARPGHLRPTVILARIATARGDHAEAVTLWAGVPPGDDNYRERLIKRGRGLLALGRPREAMAEFHAALRLDPDDKDALPGAADAAEAAGSVHAALRHWRRCLKLPALRPQAEARMAVLSGRLPRPLALAPALRNASLREWRGAAMGQAGAEAVEPAPGLVLRSLRPDGRLRFAATEPREARPGDLPDYALWLQAEGAGAEACFALEPGASAALDMAIELRATAGAPLEVALLLRQPGIEDTALLRIEAGMLARLLPFAFRPAGPILPGAGLVLHLPGPGSLVLRPPRALARPAAQPASAA